MLNSAKIACTLAALPTLSFASFSTTKAPSAVRDNLLDNRVGNPSPTPWLESARLKLEALQRTDEERALIDSISRRLLSLPRGLSQDFAGLVIHFTLKSEEGKLRDTSMILHDIDTELQRRLAFYSYLQIERDILHDHESEPWSFFNGITGKSDRFRDARENFRDALFNGDGDLKQSLKEYELATIALERGRLGSSLSIFAAAIGLYLACSYLSKRGAFPAVNGKTDEYLKADLPEEITNNPMFQHIAEIAKRDDLGWYDKLATTGALANYSIHQARYDIRTTFFSAMLVQHFVGALGAAGTNIIQDNPSLFWTGYLFAASILTALSIPLSSIYTATCPDMIAARFKVPTSSSSTESSTD